MEKKKRTRMGDIRVQATAKNGWLLYVAFPTQTSAVEAARKLAKTYRRELVIYGRDGKVRSKDSYGNDPRKIKG